MVYTPKYVTEANVEAIVQFAIDTTTDPSTAELLTWIEDLEGEIDAMKLGWDDGGSEGDGYAKTNEYIDVPSRASGLTPLKRFMYLSRGIDPDLGLVGVYVPVDDPIITISAMSVRSTGLTTKPTWTSLTQGYYSGWTEAADSDYLLVFDERRGGAKVGRALYFYGGNVPRSGRARLKASYKYSWSVPSSILQRYCELVLAAKCMGAAVEAGEPTRIAAWVGGNLQTFTNQQLEVQITAWLEEALILAEKYFPKKSKAGILLI